jgi:nitroreductase
LKGSPYGDHFESNGLCFEVIDMDGNRVDKVLVVPLNKKHQEWIDRKHPPAKHDLLLILEAARWGPTAHNMQNFDILVVDDNNQLEKLLNIEFRISEDFLRENYQQLSFSRRGADPRESRNSSEQCPHHRGGLLVIGARLH